MADDEVAELYGLPLDEFTARRNAVARELRKGGDKDRAADVAKLKRPTVGAWAVNQLARQHRKDMDLLLDAGHRLRTGQVQAVASGDQSQFEQARRDHERAIRKLVTDAREILAKGRGAATEQALASIERTLRYASIDDEHRPALASGTLTTEVEAPGFGAFAGMALPAQPAAKPKREAAREHKERIAAARAALKEAQGRERDAERRVAQAERELADAREALAAAEAETGDAEERLRDVT
jgi:DNA repair exonuclease SbcCD ATPase subunit